MAVNRFHILFQSHEHLLPTGVYGVVEIVEDPKLLDESYELVLQVPPGFLIPPKRVNY